jgi:LAGLIDADG endonuclease
MNFLRNNHKVVGSNKRYLSLSVKGINNNILNPQFVTGFTDAEGTFQISITKNTSLKAGWRVRAHFVIHLHKRDVPLLYLIKDFFGIGNIHYNPSKEDATFEVSKLEDLINVISHFNKYHLKSAKSIDYLLWKQCIELMRVKAHFTQTGLEEIISIKAAINLGLSKELKAAFSHVIPIVRLPYVIDENPLNPYWVSGFSEGDSTFSISISSKNYIRTSYQIGLNEREIFLLFKIQSFFNNVGSIKNDPSNQASQFNVTRKSDLINTIIPHFNTYKLVGNKLSNFLIWSEIVEIMNSDAHLTPEGFAKIKSLKDQLNK